MRPAYNNRSVLKVRILEFSKTAPGIKHKRMARGVACVCLMLAAAAPIADAFAFTGAGMRAIAGDLAGVKGATVCPRRVLGLRMQVQEEEKKAKDPEEVTKKYGLEAGIFTALTLVFFPPSFQFLPFVLLCMC